MSFPVAILGALQNLEQWCKQNIWRRVTADSTVQTGPCYLFHARIESDGNGDADARIYNNPGGANGNFLQLYTTDEDARDSAFNPPLYFSQGLYIDVGTNVDSVFIHYRPVN